GFRAAHGAGEGGGEATIERVESDGAPVEPEQQAGDVQDEINDIEHETSNVKRDTNARRPFPDGAHIIFNSVSAISLGVADTPMPASLKAAIFAAAVPLPPLTMAPAWPMRRPGGAVAPAINPATGFLQFFLIHSAASSSALPPISPIMMIPCVSGSSLNILMTSRCEVPLTGSPPMPTQVPWPTPRSVNCQTASYVNVPLRETTPMWPFLWM